MIEFQAYKDSFDGNYRPTYSVFVNPTQVTQVHAAPPDQSPGTPRALGFTVIWLSGEKHIVVKGDVAAIVERLSHQ